MKRLTREKVGKEDKKEFAICNHEKLNCDDSCQYGTCEWSRNALMRLKCYEDTGLTPGEIMDGKMLTGWIPVEERLPEDGTYLCTLDGELCGIDESFTGMCGIENGEWDEEDCVIAWMPLPDPYKPENQKHS